MQVSCSGHGRLTNKHQSAKPNHKAASILRSSDDPFVTSDQTRAARTQSSLQNKADRASAVTGNLHRLERRENERAEGINGPSGAKLGEKTSRNSTEHFGHGRGGSSRRMWARSGLQQSPPPGGPPPAGAHWSTNVAQTASTSVPSDVFLAALKGDLHLLECALAEEESSSPRTRGGAGASLWSPSILFHHLPQLSNNEVTRELGEFGFSFWLRNIHSGRITGH